MKGRRYMVFVLQKRHYQPSYENPTRPGRVCLKARRLRTSANRFGHYCTTRQSWQENLWEDTKTTFSLNREVGRHFRLNDPSRKVFECNHPRRAFRRKLCGDFPHSQ